MYLVYSEGSIREEADPEAIRAVQTSYDLWVDLEKGIFHEKTLGRINLGGKRVLGRLFIFLLTEAGKQFTPEEVYVPVWQQEVRGLSEHTAVRTSISRLRTLVEPAAPEWQYIMKTEPTFWSGEGAYYFNSGANYCMLAPKTASILSMDPA